MGKTDFGVQLLGKAALEEIMEQKRKLEEYKADKEKVWKPKLDVSMAFTEELIPVLCSKCNKCITCFPKKISKYNYCPHCGAKIKEKIIYANKK